jgi:predicted PurR-regulated permease PerM
VSKKQPISFDQIIFVLLKKYLSDNKYKLIEEARMMAKTRLQEYIISPISMARWLLVLVVTSGIYFFHGFIAPVLAALVIGFASWPLYKKFLNLINGRRTLGASIAIAFIVSFIVGPISMALSYAIAELGTWVKWLMKVNKDGAETPAWIANLPSIGPNLSEIWNLHLGQPGAFNELGAIFGSNIGNISKTVLAAGGTAFSLILSLVFMLITLFFVYRNGASIAAQVNKVGEFVLPGKWERFSGVVPATISSTVTGMTVIAIGEGIVLGIAYWIAGAPSPITLGVVTAFMALIPGGAPLSFTMVSGARWNSSLSTRRFDRNSSADQSSCRSYLLSSALSAALRLWDFLGFSSAPSLWRFWLQYGVSGFAKLKLNGTKNKIWKINNGK